MNLANGKTKRLSLTCVFLSLFILGTILMFIVPTSVKITYDLTTETEDGVTISFNVFEPINGDPIKKAIICGHGVMDNKEWMKSYAIEFAAAGFVAVALDFRGHGLSSGQLIWNDLIKDVQAIKDYLNNSRTDIDINNLGYIGFSMGGWPGNQIVKIDPAFKCYIGAGTILNITRGELNPNRTLNILMLQAKYDEVFPLSQTKKSFGKLINLSADEVVCNRLYGSFQDGNASKLFFDDNSDHIFLPWDQDSVREARDWVMNTFPDVKPVDHEFYVNTRALILFMQVFGGLAFLALIVEPLSNSIVKPKKEDFRIIDIQDESARNLTLKATIYSLVFGVVGMLIMSPIVFLPYPLAGAMPMYLFGMGFATIVLFWRISKKTNTSLIEKFKVPFQGSRGQLLRHIILGIILAAILYVILYLSFGLNYIGMLPSIYRLPWLPIYFAAILLSMIILSLLFQSAIQPKFQNGLKGVIKTALLYYAYMLLFLIAFIIVPCIIADWYFMIMIIVIAVPILFLIAFVSAFLYHKTGNIIAGTIMNTVFMTFLVCTSSPLMSLDYLLALSPFGLF